MGKGEEETNPVTTFRETETWQPKSSKVGMTTKKKNNRRQQRITIERKDQMNNMDSFHFHRMVQTEKEHHIQSRRRRDTRRRDTERLGTNSTPLRSEPTSDDRSPNELYKERIKDSSHHHYYSLNGWDDLLAAVWHGIPIDLDDDDFHNDRLCDWAEPWLTSGCDVPPLRSESPPLVPPHFQATNVETVGDVHDGSVSSSFTPPGSLPFPVGENSSCNSTISSHMTSSTSPNRRAYATKGNSSLWKVHSLSSSGYGRAEEDHGLEVSFISSPKKKSAPAATVHALDDEFMREGLLGDVSSRTQQKWLAPDLRTATLSSTTSSQPPSSASVEFPIDKSSRRSPTNFDGRDTILLSSGKSSDSNSPSILRSPCEDHHNSLSHNVVDFRKRTTSRLLQKSKKNKILPYSSCDDVVVTESSSFGSRSSNSRLRGDSSFSPLRVPTHPSRGDVLDSRKNKPTTPLELGMPATEFDEPCQAIPHVASRSILTSNISRIPSGLDQTRLERHPPRTTGDEVIDKMENLSADGLLPPDFYEEAISATNKSLVEDLGHVLEVPSPNKATDSSICLPQSTRRRRFSKANRRVKLATTNPKNQLSARIAVHCALKTTRRHSSVFSKILKSRQVGRFATHNGHIIAARLVLYLLRLVSWHASRRRLSFEYGPLTVYCKPHEAMSLWVLQCLSWMIGHDGSGNDDDEPTATETMSEELAFLYEDSTSALIHPLLKAFVWNASIETNLENYPFIFAHENAGTQKLEDEDDGLTLEMALLPQLENQLRREIDNAKIEDLGLWDGVRSQSRVVALKKPIVEEAALREPVADNWQSSTRSTQKRLFDGMGTRFVPMKLTIRHFLESKLVSETSAVTTATLQDDGTAIMKENELYGTSVKTRDTSNIQGTESDKHVPRNDAMGRTAVQEVGVMEERDEHSEIESVHSVERSDVQQVEDGEENDEQSESSSVDMRSPSFEHAGSAEESEGKWQRTVVDLPSQVMHEKPDPVFEVEVVTGTETSQHSKTKDKISGFCDSGYRFSCRSLVCPLPFKEEDFVASSDLGAAEPAAKAAAKPQVDLVEEIVSPSARGASNNLVVTSKDTFDVDKRMNRKNSNLLSLHPTEPAVRVSPKPQVDLAEETLAVSYKLAVRSKDILAIEKGRKRKNSNAFLLLQNGENVHSSPAVRVTKPSIRASVKPQVDIVEATIPPSLARGASNNLIVARSKDILDVEDGRKRSLNVFQRLRNGDNDSSPALHSTEVTVNASTKPQVDLVEEIGYPSARAASNNLIVVRSKDLLYVDKRRNRKNFQLLENGGHIHSSPEIHTAEPTAKASAKPQVDLVEVILSSIATGTPDNLTVVRSKDFIGTNKRRHTKNLNDGKKVKKNQSPSEVLATPCADLSHASGLSGSSNDCSLKPKGSKSLMTIKSPNRNKSGREAKTSDGEFSSVNFSQRIAALVEETCDGIFKGTLSAFNPEEHAANVVHRAHSHPNASLFDERENQIEEACSENDTDQAHETEVIQDLGFSEFTVAKPEAVTSNTLADVIPDRETPSSACHRRRHDHPISKEANLHALLFSESASFDSDVLGLNDSSELFDENCKGKDEGHFSSAKQRNETEEINHFTLPKDNLSRVRPKHQGAQVSIGPQGNGQISRATMTYPLLSSLLRRRDPALFLFSNSEESAATLDEVPFEEPEALENVVVWQSHSFLEGKRVDVESREEINVEGQRHCDENPCQDASGTQPQENDCHQQATNIVVPSATIVKRPDDFDDRVLPRKRPERRHRRNNLQLPEDDWVPQVPVPKPQEQKARQRQELKASDDWDMELDIQSKNAWDLRVHVQTKIMESPHRPCLQVLPATPTNVVHNLPRRPAIPHAVPLAHKVSSRKTPPPSRTSLWINNPSVWQSKPNFRVPSKELWRDRKISQEPQYLPSLTDRDENTFFKMR